MNTNPAFFLEQLLKPSETAMFSWADVMLAMCVSALLCLVLAQVYRHTHRGTNYSQSFLVTMFVMSVATSIVMIIIGSNIARAFSLVGALSIIRFRTAVKDSRDTAYLFAAMIVGMGCGTKFYMPAMAFTVFIAILLIVLYISDYGLKKKMESIIRVTFRKETDAVKQIEHEMGQSFKSFQLINRILDVDESHETNVYVVRPRRNTEADEFESRLEQVEGIVNISLYQSDQHAPF